MSDQILQSPQQMLDKAGTYSRCKESLDSLIQTLTSTNEELRPSWKGQTANAYFSSWDNSWKKMLIDMSAMLGNISKTLNTEAQEAIQRDVNGAKKYQ